MYKFLTDKILSFSSVQKVGFAFFIYCFASVSVMATPTNHTTVKHTHTAKKSMHSKHQSKHRQQKLVNKKHKPAPVANIQSNPIPAITAPVEQPKHWWQVSSIEERLVNFVHKTVATLRYSVYKLGGSRFDPYRGVYIVDCSSYVDRILQAVYPDAYSNLVNWTGSEKPTTHDYYDFFTSLPAESKYHWKPVEDVADLRPGDILVFRYKNAAGNETGGHVMIVMDRPIADDEDAFLVKVADSAAGGHSQDTRQAHVSGIGIGTLLLKKDPKTYQPAAFAWRVGGQLKHNVNFAMARPMDIDA
jgi:hypothetical protein